MKWGTNSLQKLPKIWIRPNHFARVRLPVHERCLAGKMYTHALATCYQSYGPSVQSHFTFCRIILERGIQCLSLWNVTVGEKAAYKLLAFGIHKYALRVDFPFFKFIEKLFTHGKNWFFRLKGSPSTRVTIIFLIIFKYHFGVMSSVRRYQCNFSTFVTVLNLKRLRTSLAYFSFAVMCAIWCVAKSGRVD